MKYALLFTMLFTASFLAAQDTLTLKDCDCHKYDNRFDLCSVTISKGQVFYHVQGYIINETLSVFRFNWRGARYKSPYMPHETTQGCGIEQSTLPVAFYTLLFFVENKRA